MPSLRVLLCANRLNPGGAERQLLLLARHLPRPEFHVTIGALYDSGDWREEAEAAADRVVTFGRHTRGGLPKAARSLAAFLRSERFDVVHPFAWPVNALVPFIAKGRAGLILGSIRTSDFHWPFPLFALVPRAEVAAMKRADLVIANSFAGRDWAVARGVAAEKIHVIENAVDESRLKPSARRESLRAGLGLKDELAVLVVARLDEVKGLEYLIRASADPRVRNTVVFIAGDGALRVSLEELSRELAAPVRFLGHRDDVADLYAASDIVALPSVHGEGFSNTIAEAMTLGRPVIATPMGDAPRLVETGVTGILVPPRDEQALADALVRANHERGERERWGRAAQERIHALCDLGTVIAKHAKIYRSSC